MTEHHTMHCPKDAEGWKKEIMKAVNIIKLDEKEMKAVASDEKSMGPAIAFIVLGALAAAVGTYIFPQEFFGVVYRPSMASMVSATIGGTIGRVIGIVVISLIAQYVFKGKAKIVEFLRVAGYAAAIGVVSIVPVLSIVAGLWGLVVMFMMLKSVHKLDTGGAIGTLVLTVVLWLALIFGLSFLAIGAFGGMYY